MNIKKDNKNDNNKKNSNKNSNKNDDILVNHHPEIFKYHFTNYYNSID